MSIDTFVFKSCLDSCFGYTFVSRFKKTPTCLRFFLWVGIWEQTCFHPLEGTYKYNLYASIWCIVSSAALLRVVSGFGSPPNGIKLAAGFDLKLLEKMILKSSFVTFKTFRWPDVFLDHRDQQLVSKVFQLLLLFSEKSWIFIDQLAAPVPWGGSAFLRWSQRSLYRAVGAVVKELPRVC